MKRKNKKGVTASLVFVFIMAVVIFAVILIFGYQAITGFLEKGEKANFLVFKNDLEAAIRNIYADYGSVVVYDVNNQFSAPFQYQEICFVDMDQGNPNLGGEFCKKRPILCDAWQTVHQNSDDNLEWDAWEKTDQNVFLTPKGVSLIKVYKIRIKDGQVNGAICLPVEQGILNFRLEGMGSHTLVSDT